MKRNIIMAALFAMLFTACRNENAGSHFMAKQPIRVDTLPGSCPYLTKDAKGNIVLSWVRNINDSTAVFCYAISADGGKTFGTVHALPSSANIHPHAENLPKMIFKPSGEIIALWGAANPNPKNKYSGLVFYVQSFDDGQTWTAPKTLVNDTASNDQRYYDVALLPNGEAAITWLDNRKTTDKEGSALYFASTEGRGGFEHDRLISQPCCQCCRTDLFVDTKGGIHVLYRGIINDSIRDMVHSVSTDGGINFSVPRRISNDNWVLKGCPHTGPAMTENKNGLQFAWFTGGRDRGCYYTASNNNGDSFGQKDSVSKGGSHPQITGLPGGGLLIVWDESVQAGNHFYKRIGIQKRNAAGVAEAKSFLTPEQQTNSYPVISAVNDKTALIAYTSTKSGKEFIIYQQVNLD